MPSQVIVPHRPGPLADAPEQDAREPTEWHSGRAGVLEMALAAGGGALFVAVFTAGLPAWLSLVAVACLALGVVLPAYAALLRAMRRRADRRRARALDRGTPLDVSDPSVLRLVTAYDRLRRTTGPGMALDVGHLALVEVARFLDGRPPASHELEYVIRRAEAVSALADRAADGPVTPVELAAPDSLARIEALLA